MLTRLSLSTVAVALAFGCAPSVQTIDRTQPNAIHKDQFRGLWYYKATIVDSDPGADAVDGYASGLDKIRWEITQGLLIGYRSYEFVPYAEGLTDDGRDFFGAPVVAYAITSHFDVRRDYSATTGVENNVLVENMTDRPWFEREYIRVDWTQNLVGGPTQIWTGWSAYPDAFFSATAISGYYNQGHQETNPHRPTFTKNYFDITNQFHVEPDLYYCYLMLLYNGVPRCGGQNATIRLSFAKVDVTNDFQSMYYPDNKELKDDSGNAIVIDFNGRRCDGQDGTGTRDPSDCRVATFPYFEAFGNFRTQRVAFDRERNLTRTGRLYLVGRFDIWKNSYDDVSGALIPYNEREPVPIVYYGNVNYPEDLIGAAQKLADMWNTPFMETVATLQGHVDATGRPDLTRLAQIYGDDFKMFQFRKNSCNVADVKAYVRANGLEAVADRVAGGVEQIARGNIENVCAAIQYHQVNELGYTMDPTETSKQLAFTWQKEGDVRINFQNYVDQDQAGPWGVAQFGTDPETGEYVSNAANYFGDAGDFISQREVDKLQWLNGDINAQEVLRGDTARNTVVSRRGSKNRSIRQSVHQALMQNDGELVNDLGDEMFEQTAPGSEGKRFEHMFAGTDIERELLVTDEILRGFAGPTMYQPPNIAGNGGNLANGSIAGLGAAPPGVVSEDALKAASPVAWGMGLENNPYEKVVRELGERAVEFADFFEPTTSGLADYVRGWDRDEIYEMLRAEMYTAVQGHEVGHTLGLRHNFSASMDALNYRPEFWEQYWNRDVTEGDPNRGLEYKYASLMDYGFGVSLEGLHGIGSYDAAAVRFMYGELVDIWDTNQVAVPDPRKFGSFARRCGHDSSWYGFPFLMAYLDYRTLPSVVSTPAGAPGEETNLDRLYRELVIRVEANAQQRGDRSGCTLFIADLNWLMREISDLEPNPANIYTARIPIPASRLISQEIATLLNPPEYDDPSTDLNEAEDGLDDDGDGIPDDIGYDWNNYMHRVPYDFCPDSYAGYAPGCQRWDTGADFLESVNHHIDAYDRDYIFNNFRRDRFSGSGWYSPQSYMYSLESRRLFHMTNVFRYYLFTRRTVFEAPLFSKWAEATYAGLNFLERIIQTPEPGSYCLDTANNRYVPKVSDTAPCAEEFEVGLGYGQGKHFNTAWTNEYYYKANRLGVFYDKLAAIRQLTSSSGRFIRSFADLFDRRAFTLGYLRAYEDPMIRRWQGLIRGEHSGYESAVVLDDDTGEKYVRYTPFLDEELDDGASVRQWLSTEPKIAPAWSRTLQFYALAYGIANWSSINDSAPEFYRYTKISIAGTPEDVEYPSDIPIVTFTDPETRITYRSPDIAARPRQVLNDDIPAYDRTHDWGIGAAILDEANAILTNEWQPSKVDCENLTGEAKEEACRRYEVARQHLNEKVGFIDIVRRFNRRAELP